MVGRIATRTRTSEGTPLTDTMPGVAQPAAAMPARDRNIIITMLVATFVVILNETIMGVALPPLMEELGITATLGQWLTTAFMLTMAVVIPTTGFLLQRLSTRTVFMLAMGLFALGTLVAALAPGFWALLAARVIQASGTALMMPLMMTTVLNLVPLERRGVVMGNVSIVISVAPAIGPTLSGLILQYLSWRFMFILVLPIAIAALVYGAKRLQNVGEPGGRSLDLVSVLLSVPGFAGLVYGLSQLGAGQGGEGGSSHLIQAVVALAVGVVCLVVFTFRQIRLQSDEVSGPLLDLRVFGHRDFTLSVLLLCVAMIALFGAIILLPIYLQTVRGLETLQTGLMLLPGGILMGVLAPVVGRLFDRIGPRGLTVFGTIVLTGVLFMFSRVDLHTPIAALIGLHLVQSLALACLFTPAFTSGLNPLPPHLYSHGSATISTLQQVAGAAGAALLVSIMTIGAASSVRSGADQLTAINDGINTAFLVASCICVAAVIVAALMRKGPAPQPEHMAAH